MGYIDFVSSPLIFSSTFILSQYDIIPIFFMLMGILAYIKKDNKKFMFFFSIAIPMKLFSLFVFLPLILLKEKKILKICGNTVLTLWLLIVSKLIQHFMPFYSLSTAEFGNAMKDKLFNSSLLKINFSNASLFVAVYVGICIFCYIKQLKNQNELNKFSLYIPFVVFLCFFSFVSFYPYWIIYLTPFFPIILFQNKKYYKINLLLDMLYSFSALFIMSSYYYWCFGTKQLENMLIPKIFGIKAIETLKYKNISEVFTMHNLNIYMSAFSGLFLIITIVFIIINYPRKEEKQEIIIERSVVWLRMLIIMAFAFLILFCYFR